MEVSSVEKDTDCILLISLYSKGAKQLHKLAAGCQKLGLNPVPNIVTVCVCVG